MTTSNLFLRPLLLLALIALIASGCKEKSTEVETDSLDTETTEVEATPFNPENELLGLPDPWFGDLDGMIERRQIRALVPYSRTHYFIDGTERRGIAFEALSLFEKQLNEKLKKEGKSHVNVIFIPVTRDKMLPALLAGRADLLAANLTVTEERKKIVDFSVPAYSGSQEVVVTGPTAPAIASLDDLQGKKVYIRLSSSFFEHIQHINDSLALAGKPLIEVEPADEHLEDEEILEMVNAGILPMAIVDNHIAKLWSQVLDSLTVREDLAIFSGGQIAWAMRPNSPQLKAEVDAFIEKNRVGTLMGNVIVNRYLKSTKYIENNRTATDLERLRQTRDFFIKYGEQYEIPWLFLVAQGYQESKLDQSLVSRAGAVGIMQIKPSTAKDPNVGVPNVYEAESNIHAGTKYLRFIADHYFGDEQLDTLNLAMFALASYNAGPNRVEKLRKEAAKNGLDPNVWFDNVEIVAAREVGREPVQYTSNIFKYYLSFQSLERHLEETDKELLEREK